jgi:hypothetical protein
LFRAPLKFDRQRLEEDKLEEKFDCADKYNEWHIGWHPRVNGGQPCRSSEHFDIWR